MTPSLVLLAPARPPDRLGPHLLLTLVLLVLFALMCFGIWRGWRRRASATAELSPLPARPEPLPEPLVAPMNGMYVGTVGPASWQDWVAGRGLGARANGEFVVTPTGVAMPALWIPTDRLRGIRTSPGLADKVMPGPGLLVVDWDWDGTTYSTGFRGEASRYDEVQAAVKSLLAGAAR